MAELDPRRLEVCLLNHEGAFGVPGDLRETWPIVVQRTVSDRNGSPDLLCACPPCQGMSSARSGRGRHDDADAGSRDVRNLLVTVVADVVAKLTPRLVVIENVPAFLTRRVRHPADGEPISAANYLISALHRNYVAFPFLADLCHYGVPQSRIRAFLTFVRRDVGGLDALLRYRRGPYPRPSTCGSECGEYPISALSALKGFGLPSLDAATPEAARSDGYGGLHAVPVWSERIYNMVAAIPPASGQSAWQNVRCLSCDAPTADLAAAVCCACAAPLPRPIVREANGEYRLVRGFGTSYRRMFPDRPAATITTASGHVGSDFTIHPTQTRLLSTLECALLQTFPADFVWGDALSKWGHTNVREMIGEAVPPAFTEQHGRVLNGVLNDAWTAAPIALSDDRITRAWDKIAMSARKDGRPDPRAYVDYLDAKSLVHSTVRSTTIDLG